MRNDNIFKTGDVVKGESLIGYEEVYRKLQRSILVNRGNLAFVGLPRMGKTSLLKKLYDEAKKSYKEIVPVFVNMAELVGEDKPLFDSLLIYIAEEIQDELEQRLSQDRCENFCYVMNKFQKARFNDESTFRKSFKKLFKELENLNMRALVILDEFDSAEKVFETHADYELFRSLADPDYAISLVFISRRRLYMIEKKNINNSTFHGAFKESPLRGFGAQDSTLLFEALKNNYDIELLPEQRERIFYYAGRSPYIYSAFCHELVEKKINGQTSFDIDEIYKDELASLITTYSEDLYERLEFDGHLSKIIGILFGPSINITRSDEDLLSFMGYLTTQGDKDLLSSMGYLNLTSDNEYYQALSGYFTDYLHNKHYVDDSWGNIIALEKLMKKLALEAFQSFDETQWKEIMDEAYRQIFRSTKTFNYFLYKGYIDNNLKIFNKNSTLLDVMSLHDVFVVIRFRWDEIFKKYFGSKSFSNFEDKFKLCALARNPLAHGHKEYLTKLQIEQVNIYCNEILEIVKKNHGTPKTNTSTNPTANKNLEVNSSSNAKSESSIRRDYIGKISTLTNIGKNKNRGIKGTVFNAGGTIERALLKHQAEYYLGRNLKVEVLDINPQGNGYILKAIED